MGSHALLSASSSHRWLNCTPSAQLEQSFSGRETTAAAEGTAAHALCEYKLRAALGTTTVRPVSEYDCEEMEEHTDAYVSFVIEQFELAKQSCTDPLTLIEQRLDFSAYVPQGYGTGDCIIVTDGMLHVIDFKYGRGVLVEAADNPQMKLYALGALGIYDSLYDITDISMTIFQPRRANVSTWVTSADALRDWAEHELKPRAELAMSGEGEYILGEWCTFCRAASRCRARAEDRLTQAQSEFRSPPLMSDEEIEELLPQLPELVRWANEIIAYATESAVNGKSWRGFTLGRGRTVRRYTDETAVAEAAMANGYTDIFRQSLIPMTEMRKLMGAKQFESVLGSFLCEVQGKPTLVPAKNEFKKITEERQK